MGCINLVVGGEAACQVAKQIDYNPTRANSGMLDAAVTSQANSYGLEWAKLLTPGAYTATNFQTGQNAGFEGGNGNGSRRRTAPSPTPRRRPTVESTRSR